MTSVPPVFGGRRALGVALITASAVAQALAAGAAAFATREVFAALHAGGADLPLPALGTLFLAGAAIAGLRVFGRVIAERTGQDFAMALRRVLFKHLTRMPAGAVAQRRTGALPVVVDVLVYTPVEFAENEVDGFGVFEVLRREGVEMMGVAE